MPPTESDKSVCQKYMEFGIFQINFPLSAFHEKSQYNQPRREGKQNCHLPFKKKIQGQVFNMAV